MRKMLRSGVAALCGLGLIALLGILAGPPRTQAQGGTGFTKVGSTATTSFTTATLTDGATYQFEVTGTNTAGESVPSNIVSVQIPATGTHTVIVSWTAGLNDTGYNVYDFLVPAPVAPTGVTVTVN